MNNLQTQMATLMQNIASVASERKKAVRDIKAQTASSLQAFDAERTAMAAALRGGLASDRMCRCAEVLELLDNANKMSQGFRKDHEVMGVALRQSLVESREFVVNSVKSLCIEFTQERHEFAKGHRQMAQAQGKALAKDRLDRSNTVTALMNAFNSAHLNMATTQSASLAQCRRNRSHSLLELMHGFHPARRGMLTVLAPVVVSLPAAVAEVEREAAEEPIAAFNWPATPLADNGTDTEVGSSAVIAQVLEPEVIEGVRHFKPKMAKSRKK